MAHAKSTSTQKTIQNAHRIWISLIYFQMLKNSFFLIISRQAGYLWVGGRVPISNYSYSTEHRGARILYWRHIVFFLQRCAHLSFLPLITNIDKDKENITDSLPFSSNKTSLSLVFIPYPYPWAMRFQEVRIIFFLHLNIFGQKCCPAFPR